MNYLPQRLNEIFGDWVYICACAGARATMCRVINLKNVWVVAITVQSH